MNAPPGATTATPSQPFTDALPALRRLDEELAAALTPAMTRQERPCGYGAVAWMLAKLLHYLLQAASGDQVAEALAEVEADARAVLHRVHELRHRERPRRRGGPVRDPADHRIGNGRGRRRSSRLRAFEQRPGPPSSAGRHRTTRRTAALRLLGDALTMVLPGDQYEAAP